MAVSGRAFCIDKEDTNAQAAADRVGASGRLGEPGSRADPLHDKLIDAFNNRQWEDVKPLLADDSVYHRANADEVYKGPDDIAGHFEKTIGGEWNVKFVKLDSDSAFTGQDGRVVERGDFAITAGGDDSSCYRGSYMATWAPRGDDWQLQVLSWQDVETALENCN